MADRLMRAGMLVAMALLAAMQPATADVLIDPTRPPDGIAAVAGNGAAYPGDAAKMQPVSRGLQMVIISDIRRAAVIDGRTVELGGKYGDAKLIEVNEGGIVLQGKQGRRVLKLFPKVKMTKAEMKIELPVAESAPAVVNTEHKASGQEEGQ